MGRFSVGKQGACTREPHYTRAAHTAATSDDLPWFSGADRCPCQVAGYRGVADHLSSGQ
ncbi:hypothetical protein D3C81_1866640 [compost metagenome]